MFVLACDLRFAPRKNTVLGRWKVGVGVVPGDGPMARILVADDLDGPRAEQYAYVNRLIADARHPTAGDRRVLAGRDARPIPFNPYATGACHARQHRDPFVPGKLS